MATIVCERCGGTVKWDNNHKEVECPYCGNVIKSRKIEREDNIENPLLERARIFLEDKEWDEAKKYCERVLDKEPHNAYAYLYEAMIEYGITTIELLRNNASGRLESEKAFVKALKYAEGDFKNELEEMSRHSMKLFMEEVEDALEESASHEEVEDALRLAIYYNENGPGELPELTEAVTRLTAKKEAMAKEVEGEEKIPEINNNRLTAKKVTLFLDIIVVAIIWLFILKWILI